MTLMKVRWIAASEMSGGAIRRGALRYESNEEGRK